MRRLVRVVSGVTRELYMRIALAFALLGWAGPVTSAEGDGAATCLVPRLEKADLDAQTWDGPALYAAAFKGMAMPPEDEDGGAPGGAARFRAGWTDRGLRLLVEVRDATPNEEFEIYEGDSVEFMIARDAADGGHRLQYIVAPGRAPGQAEPRLQLFDWRDQDKRDPASLAEYETRATDGGYAVDLFVPWAFLGLDAKEGMEFGLQVQVNEVSGAGKRRLLWFPIHSGGDTRHPLRAMRLAGPGAASSEPLAVTYTYRPHDGLAMHLAADGARAGQTVRVELDGHELGEATMGPDRGGWSEGRFAFPLELEGERPRRFTVSFADGASVSVPCRVAFAYSRTLADWWQGENYAVNAAFRYAMECMKENPAYHYNFFAGVLGDTFAQLHTDVPNRPVGSLSETFPGAATWRPAFEACGYPDFHVVEKAEIEADPERWRAAVLNELVRGKPVLFMAGFKRGEWINPFHTGVFAGYEDGGRTLLVTSQEKDTPMLAPGDVAGLDRLAFFGEKREAPTLADSYRRALERVPALLARPAENGVAFGRAAYDGWADAFAKDDVRAGFRDLELDWWWTNGTYICLTATNNHHIRPFLEEARRLNPDLGPTIDGLVRVYDRMGDVQDRLEGAGGGFALRREMMDDKEAVDKIVAVIREYGPLCDLLTEVFKNPDAAPPAPEAAPAATPEAERKEGAGDADQDAVDFF